MLLHDALEDALDPRVVERLPRRDLGILDRRARTPDHPETLLLAGAQRRRHVLVEPSSERRRLRHANASRRVIRAGYPSPLGVHAAGVLASRRVELGLVGLANSGKTSLFNLITGDAAEVAAYPYSTREPRKGAADVPDPRIDAIADVQDIPRRVPAQVQVVDIAGLAAGAGRGEGLGGQALGRLREVDALIHVVRGFANAEVGHPLERIDPAADVEAVDLELVLADREQLARREEKTAKAARTGDAGAKAELAAIGATRRGARRGDTGTGLRRTRPPGCSRSRWAC